VYAYTFDGAWFDIGTPESYLETVAWALEGDSTIAAEATVEGSDIGTGVHIMPGAVVKNSIIERSVVLPEAIVEDATCSNTKATSTVRTSFASNPPEPRKSAPSAALRPTNRCGFGNTRVRRAVTPRTGT
jgi:NDP-sugar pyrophosphorylase family protein